MGIDFPEGATPLDPKEAEGLIPPISLQSELNEFEALNIAEAYDWAARSRKVRDSLLDSDTLKEMHRRMFNRTWRWAGRYRQTQKSIGVEAWRIASDTQNLLDDARYWIEQATYRPDEICARFHHRLVCIHAFPNGNGRHARLAADFLAASLKVELFTWGSDGPADVGDVRRAYIDALRAADAHDIAPLLRFMRS